MQIASCHSGDVLCISRRDDPNVHALFIDGDAGRREARVGERPDGYGQKLLHALGLVVDRSATVWAKVEFDAGAFVSNRSYTVEAPASETFSRRNLACWPKTLPVRR